MPGGTRRRRAGVRFMLLLSVLGTGLFCPVPALGQRPADFAGDWSGTLAVPGAEIPLVVHLVHEGGRWSGTADSPMQGAAGLPLARVRVQGASLEFALANIPGEPRFQGELRAGSIHGTFSQSGQTFPLILSRQKLELPQRPQEPKPPFPYREEEVVCAGGDVTLAGTLTIPEGEGPFPAVLLLSGSGAQNRDGEILGHKPILVLADDLTRAGIAVLRMDDRGVGGSTGRLGRSTLEDLAGDANAAARLLRRRPEIDPARVGLLGQSQGGLVAILAAQGSDSVAFVVLLASPGVSGVELMVRQTEMLAAAAGDGPADIRRKAKSQEGIMKLVAAGADSAALHAELRKALRAEAMATGEGRLPADADLEARIRSELRTLRSPIYVSLVASDPRPALKELRTPVLALGGDLDQQVDPQQNLPEIRRALELAGNEDVTTHSFPGLNHLFQRAQTGGVEAYGRIEQTMDPAVLKKVREWIRARFGRPGVAR